MSMLSDAQRKVLGVGITFLSLAVVLVFVAFAARCLLKLLAFTAPAIVPVIVGFFLALFFRPYYRWWRRFVPNETVALLIMLLTVFVPIGFIIWYAGSFLVDQIQALVTQGPHLVHQMIEWARATFPGLFRLLARVGVPYESVGRYFSQYGNTAVVAGAGVLKTLSCVISVLVTIIFFVCFLVAKEKHGREMISHLPFFKEDTRDFLAEQIDAFFAILVSFFQRQTVICLIEGVLYGLGFFVVGVPYGFLLGFTLGCMNLVPFFGSVVCLPIALLFSYFGADGSATRVVLALVVWLVGQGLDGYVITPRIQGNRMGIGYAGVIFSFFFWSTVMGPLLGMLLAIPLSAFCVVLWRAIKARYIRPIL